MASIYKRKNSPYWWLKYKDPVSGKLIRESTLIRHGDATAYRAALQLRDKKAEAEHLAGLTEDAELFANWVERWIEVQYQHSPRTKHRILNAWHNLQTYFSEIKITHPQQVTRQILLDYVPWRNRQGSFRGRRRLPLSPNTIILELKMCGIILQEAITRGIITANPAHKLKLKRTKPRIKSEPTQDQINTIRALIAQKVRQARTPEEIVNADFLHVSFEIAYHQGLRMAETRLDLRKIDWENGRILNHSTKGNKQFEPLINPELMPLLKRLRDEGRTHAYKIPTKNNPQLLWFEVFDYLRSKDPSFNDVSFHSLRVHLISRAHRAGVPESVVMKMVNHSSTTQHRIYRRVQTPELLSAWSSISSHANAANGEKSDKLSDLEGKRISGRNQGLKDR